MPILTVKGQPIHVVVKGAPTRQLALLIHGWSSSWYALSPLLDMLAQRFYCMAVDLPGYGKSPRLPERTTIARYAELLLNLIEQVSDGPAVLVGHSMGGMTSLTMALQEPDLIERMVLVGPTITGRLSMYINAVVSPITLLERFGLGSLIVSGVEGALVGISDRIMRPASFAERTSISANDYKRLREDARSPGQGRVRAECFMAMRENNLSGRLSGIEVPTLILWGAEDNTVPLRDSGVVADEWPQADLRILPKAGHWPQFEAPQATRRLVAAYLGLPLSGDKIHTPTGDEELLRVQEIAQFLAHSDIGRDLNMPQRVRLAAQCVPRSYTSGQSIVKTRDTGREFYVLYSGGIEIWSDPENPTDMDSPNKRHVADLKLGQMTGELAMFDEGLRSADLIAGAEGAVVLAFARDQLLALCEDDAVLGTHLLWNLAAAMTQRVRFILAQLRRASQRVAAYEKTLEKSLQSKE